MLPLCKQEQEGVMWSHMPRHSVGASLPSAGQWDCRGGLGGLVRHQLAPFGLTGAGLLVPGHKKSASENGGVDEE